MREIKPGDYIELGPNFNAFDDPHTRFRQYYIENSNYEILHALVLDIDRNDHYVCILFDSRIMWLDAKHSHAAIWNGCSIFGDVVSTIDDREKKKLPNRKRNRNG